MTDITRTKQTNKKKWIWISLSIIGVLVLGLGAYIYSIYSSLQDTVTVMHEPIEREHSEKRIEKVIFEEQDPIAVLLMGVDERGNDRGRSDSLIVITVNPKTNSMQMVSIPRDTRTEIIGKGFQDKINHAYAFGGTEMAMATIENFLDIPIDYFVKVNMESFKEIVDAVGGVTVNNTFEFDYEGEHFAKGEIFLTGETALKYSRMRYDDPRGDFGRQDRQKQIIKSVIDEGASFSSLANYGSILNVIGSNIKTNLSFSEMMDIQKNYKDARHNLEQFQINGKGAKINGIYYYVVSEEDRKALSTKLKEHLEIGGENVTKR